MPKALGFAPGARLAPGITVLTRTTSWRDEKLGVAYMIEVTEPSGSTHIPSIDGSLAPRWTIESSLPSRVAPSAILWRVAALPPMMAKGCGRRTASLTGRLGIRPAEPAPG